MPDPLVRFDVDDGIGVVRLDRPPANAISLRLALDLLDALREAGSRDDVGAIVLWGGPKLLAAGADIKEMVDHGPDEIRKQVGALGDACDFLEALPKISIAAITGFALGGGFELSLACDLRYAADDAKLGQPEVAIGVMPGAGGTQRMTWLAGLGVARDLTYTGRQVDAAEARALGLVERVYPPGEVFDAAVRDARALAHGPRGALAAAKEALREAVRDPGRAGIAREKELFIALFGTHDQREGMRAFIEKRPPTFQGN
ncbi:MAG TPA: enoyl-CoA hydratase-related protein [Actinomycetota bacterium]|nr:enoyl-CoA hydratase-related protein [Actinomycetota bacterium]